MSLNTEKGPGMDIKNFLTVTRFTIFDELHNKSFYVLTAVAVPFVLLLRGCFHSNMVVNGQEVNATTIGYNASVVAFNIIASAGVLIAVLLAMRVFKRDVDDGMAIAILSKPVKRIDYVSGKIAGVWILSYGLTLILHITVYIIMLPEYRWKNSSLYSCFIYYIGKCAVCCCSCDAFFDDHAGCDCCTFYSRCSICQPNIRFLQCGFSECYSSIDDESSGVLNLFMALSQHNLAEINCASILFDFTNKRNTVPIIRFGASFT